MTLTDRFQWLSKDVPLPELPYPAVEQWIAAVAERHGGRIIGSLNYLFCNDGHILAVNREFLSHDYFTDIITFDDCRGRLLRGDMVISLETVSSNAALQGVDYMSELYRVIIHGVLHLCGIGDKAPGEREIMEMHENQALALLPGFGITI